MCITAVILIVKLEAWAVQITQTEPVDPLRLFTLYFYLSFWSAVTLRRFHLPGRVPVTKARTRPRTPNATGGRTITVGHPIPCPGLPTVIV
jgi:hypothetical protein